MHRIALRCLTVLETLMQALTSACFFIARIQCVLQPFPHCAFPHSRRSARCRYHLGALHFPIINGPIEGILMLSGMHFLTAINGASSSCDARIIVCTIHRVCASFQLSVDSVVCVSLSVSLSLVLPYLKPPSL